MWWRFVVVAVILWVALWATKHVGWPDADLGLTMLAIFLWSAWERTESLEKKIRDLEARLDRVARGSER
jgi:hypothetical protein